MGARRTSTLKGLSFTSLMAEATLAGERSVAFQSGNNFSLSAGQHMPSATKKANVMCCSSS